MKIIIKRKILNHFISNLIELFFKPNFRGVSYQHIRNLLRSLKVLYLNKMNFNIISSIGDYTDKIVNHFDDTSDSKVT